MVSDMNIIIRLSLAIFVAGCILPSGEYSFVQPPTALSYSSSFPSAEKHPRNNQVKIICLFSVSYEQHL